MIAFLLVTWLTVAGDVPRSRPIEKCAVSYLDGKGNTSLKFVSSLHVAGIDFLTFQTPSISEGKINGIMCGRESLVPDASDWIVLHAGLPFFISAGDRILALELPDGHLQARMVQGVLTAREQVSVQARLDELQLRFMKSEHESPEPLKK